MIVIRRADANDIPWLLTELRQFDTFFGAGRSLMPDDMTAVEKLTALMNEEMGCFFVAESRTPFTSLSPAAVAIRKVGFIVGILAPHYLNPAIRTLNEVLWWVSPYERGARAGKALLDAYELFGRERADWVTMTLEADSPVNPESLERRGYRLKERNYLLEVC